MKKTLVPTLLFLAASAAFAQESSAKTRELERKLSELQARVDALADAASADIRAQLEEVRRQVDTLTKEIETLKSGVPEKAPEAGGTGAFGVGPAASRVYTVNRGVSIGGYGEFLYENFDSRRQNGSPSGRTNQIDLLRAILYFGYKFDDHFLFNSELEVEHAVTASDKGGETAVEFAYLDWRHTRATNLRAGLVLIPMGFLNELHEPPVFLAARRPEVEQVIIPSTWRELGLGFYGDTGVVSYRAYLVNGLTASRYVPEGIAEGKQEGSQAIAKDFAVTGRLDFTPLPGTLVGASFFTGNSAQGRATPSGKSFGGRTTLVDLHAEWRWRGIRARSLFVDTRIADAAEINALNGLTGDQSVGCRQRGWYLEGGYDLFSWRPARVSVVPFVRWERYDTQREVPAGFERNPENNVSVLTLGAVFKPIENIAVKIDWQRRRTAARTGANQWNLALGYLF